MIPTSLRRSEGCARRRLARSAGWLGAALLVACAAPRETTLSRTQRQRELEAARVERARWERELEVLQHRLLELQTAIRRDRAESIRLAAVHRATQAELLQQVDRVMVAERDLAAARQRAQQIEQELGPVRALEAQRAAAEQRRGELQAQLTAVLAEVTAAEQQVAAKSQELAPRLLQLQQQVAAAQQIEAALAAAQAAIRDAAAPLAPAPAQPPAPAEPAKQPAK